MVTAEQLIVALSEVVLGDLLEKNMVGNLSIYRGPVYVGYVDLQTAETVYLEGLDEPGDP